MEHSAMLVCFPMSEKVFRIQALEPGAYQGEVKMLQYACLLTDNQLYTILSLRQTASSVKYAHLKV